MLIKTRAFGRAEFLVSGGIAAGGQKMTVENDEKKFLVNNDTGTACTAAACSSPSRAFVDTSRTF